MRHCFSQSWFSQVQSQECNFAGLLAQPYWSLHQNSPAVAFSGSLGHPWCKALKVIREQKVIRSMPTSNVLWCGERHLLALSYVESCINIYWEYQLMNWYINWYINSRVRAVSITWYGPFFCIISNWYINWYWYFDNIKYQMWHIPIVERAFGVLKARWKFCKSNINYCDPHVCRECIEACCWLHNY
jgi:hypothetical protein